MLNLTDEDRSILEQIAVQNTTDEEQRTEITKILTEGFSYYGDQELVDRFGGKKELFEARSIWLIENHTYAVPPTEEEKEKGLKSQAVFMSKEGVEDIKRLVRSFNVPSKDVEDLSQDIIIKFWRYKHAEVYNPLKSPWGYHVRSSVKTCVATYWSRRSRTPTDTGFHFQQYRLGTKVHNEEFELEPYLLEQDLSPQDTMILDEFYAAFRDFLRKQKSFGSTIYKGYREICILLPPGTREIKTEEEVVLFVIAKGRDNYRVTRDGWKEEGKSILVPLSVLKEFENSEGQKVKYTRNPEYNPHPQEIIRYERNPLDVFELLNKGHQVVEIAKELRVSPSTAHNWVRTLESLFRTFWVETDLIPEELKYLGVGTFECPHCKKHYHSHHEKCEKCGTLLRDCKREIRLTVYPWQPVRGSQDIKDRSDRYKPSMTAPVCAI